ncbi:MAG: hypothetical protein KY462_05165 [Actinobacteria bacterium]|nr:hypothetical protein [Actinomycetota bacterium]
MLDDVVIHLAPVLHAAGVRPHESDSAPVTLERTSMTEAGRYLERRRRETEHTLAKLKDAREAGR